MKKILNANFEESLNLIDDSLVKYMIEDVEQSGKKEKPILLKILAFLLILLLYGLTKLSVYLMKSSDNDFIPIPDVNFLTVHVFIVLFLIFILIWIVTKTKNGIHNRFFYSFINTNNYLLWLVTEVNLLFLTFFLKPLTTVGIVILLVIFIFVSTTILISKARAIKKILFNVEVKKNQTDIVIKKILKFIFKYGLIIVLIYVVWKIIFPSTIEIGNDLIGFIGIILMWLVLNIGFVMAEAYLFLPYLLYGYYKLKYPEEYREWEGKTQIEWYGEKYFNKYIKGTEKEEKIDDGQ